MRIILLLVSLIGPTYAAAQIKVVTTFTILADMAANVAGEHADVISITKHGAEIHGYTPTPKDILSAMDADIVLRNGWGLEAWFEQFLRNLPNVPNVTLTDGLEPLFIDARTDQPNPHAWMSLAHSTHYILNIAQALSTVDPSNEAEYFHNAHSYILELEQTLNPIKQSLNRLPENRRWLVSCEGAFGYLAQDLGLRELYIWPMNIDQSATAQQMRTVIDKVRIENIPVVFCESTISQAPAEQIVRETDARYGGVLYVDSLSREDGPVPTYLDLMRVTMSTIAEELLRD